MKNIKKINSKNLKNKKNIKVKKEIIIPVSRKIPKLNDITQFAILVDKPCRDLDFKRMYSNNIKLAFLDYDIFNKPDNCVRYSRLKKALYEYKVAFGLKASIYWHKEMYATSFLERKRLIEIQVQELVNEYVGCKSINTARKKFIILDLKLDPKEKLIFDHKEFHTLINHEIELFVNYGITPILKITNKEKQKFMNVTVNFNKMPRCNFLLDYDIITEANLNRSEFDLSNISTYSKKIIPTEDFKDEDLEYIENPINILNNKSLEIKDVVSKNLFDEKYTIKDCESIYNLDFEKNTYKFIDKTFIVDIGKINKITQQNKITERLEKIKEQYKYTPFAKTIKFFNRRTKLIQYGSIANIGGENSVKATKHFPLFFLCTGYNI